MLQSTNAVRPTGARPLKDENGSSAERFKTSSDGEAILGGTMTAQRKH